MVLTIATIVRNEADRFLPSALEAWKAFSDRIVVLDDGSDDGTAEICEEAGCEVHRKPAKMFGNEWVARRELWRLASKGADWILHLDADQVMSEDPRPYLKPPVTMFRVYDLWTPDTYRDDSYWSGHSSCWWQAVHVPSLPEGFKDQWIERGWHSGHVPLNVPGPKHPTPPTCAVLHYAYSTPELRKAKAKMYAALSPHLTTQERSHAWSILARASTKPLPFEPKWTLRLKTSA